MFLLHPFQPGFAERTVVLASGIAALNILLLASVLARTHGRACALAACAALALMPGACFFDVWIKTDHTVTTFGLLALLAAISGRTVLCGVLMGLALLSKETAVFYLLPVAFVLWGKGPLRDAWRRLAVWLAVALASSLWWYLWVAPRHAGGGGGLTRIMDHVRFAGDGGAGWVLPWTYYFQLLPPLLGISGLVLAAAGVVMLLLPGASCGQPPQASRMLRFWPLVWIIPVMAGLSLLPGKVPWILISLMPAFAVLQGAAVAPLLNRAWMKGPVAGLLAGAALCIVFVIPGPVFRVAAYEEMLKIVSPDQWRGSGESRKIARKLNGLAGPEDRVLLTSFHYWKGVAPGSQCPVFTCYFTGGSQFLLRPHELSFPQLESDIRQYQIDWAVLSPEPGEAERNLIGGLMKQHGLRPVGLEKAAIFDTSTIR